MVCIGATITYAQSGPPPPPQGDTCIDTGGPGTARYNTGSGAEGYEIGIVVEGTANVVANIYEVGPYGGQGSHVETLELSNAGLDCSWVGHVGESVPANPMGAFASELSLNTLYRLDISQTQGPHSRSFYYQLNENNTDQNFFDSENQFAAGGTNLPSGFPDLVIVSETGGIYVKYYGTAISSSFIENEIGTQYVFPYDFETMCIEVETPTLQCDPAESRYEAVFLASVPFQTGVPALPLSFETPPNARWLLADAPGSSQVRTITWLSTDVSEIRFGQSAQLQIYGDLDVSGVTLTASNPTQGWSGVRFEAGSDGHWSGNATIEKVKGWGTASLRITNASPTFSNVRIQDAVSPSAVYGIEINGANAYPTEDDGPGGGSPGPFHTVRVLDMTSDGIRINSGANLRATDLRVEFGDAQGVVVGYSSEAFLHPHTFSSTEPGARILTNAGDGLRASNGSYATLGHYYYDQYGVYPAYGLNTFSGNTYNGLETTGGTIQGGSSDNKTTARNRIFGNISPQEAFASGGTAYLRCNWWGEDANQMPPVALAPQTGTSGSGLIYDDMWLDKNPYGSSNPVCAGGSGGARYAGDSSSLSPEAEWLLAGIESAGNPTAAMAHFERILTEAPDSPEAAAALVQIGWMAQRPNAMPEMLTRLETASRSDNAAHRHAALQGLIRVRHHERDTAGALALADQQLAGAGKNRQYIHEAQIERANLLAELGRQTEATQALAHASAQGRDMETVGYTRSVLGIREESLRAAESVIEDESVSEQALLPPMPNPTQGPIRLPLQLGESTHVRAEVLDVLGRVVATVADGPFDEGEHTFFLDTKAWAPGVYILRAELQAGEGGSVTEQKRFTVVR